MEMNPENSPPGSIEMQKCSICKEFVPRFDIRYVCITLITPIPLILGMAHKILETAKSPNSPFPLWIWLLGIWDFGLGLRLVNKKADKTYFENILQLCN